MPLRASTAVTVGVTIDDPHTIDIGWIDEGFGCETVALSVTHTTSRFRGNDLVDRLVSEEES